jgi:hypothetical protein
MRFFPSLQLADWFSGLPNFLSNGSLFWWREWHEADHSPASSAEVKNGRAQEKLCHFYGVGLKNKSKVVPVISYAMKTCLNGCIDPCFLDLVNQGCLRTENYSKRQNNLEMVLVV